MRTEVVNTQMEERLRKIQLRLNQARHENKVAATDELLNFNDSNSATNESSIYDIPMRFLKTGDSRDQGPSSLDHLRDRDVNIYKKGLNKIDKSVYDDYQKRKITGEKYKERDDVIENLAKSIEKNKMKMRERNRRAQDYDISGKDKVDFINDKNRRFNNKLARDYDKYTEDVKLSLERN